MTNPEDKNASGWRRCGPCKKMIPHGSLYYMCSVQSCRKNAFCSQACWQAHVPVMKHKDAWFEECMSPQMGQDETSSGNPERKLQAGPSASVADLPSAEHERYDEDHEILIVASKLKQYIKSQSGLNTSQQVLNVLSDIVRKKCREAIVSAKSHGRKTVLDRDFNTY